MDARGLERLACALLENAETQVQELCDEIGFRLDEGGVMPPDLTPILRKAWSLRHRYGVSGCGLFSPVALTIDEFCEKERLTDLERLCLYAWAAMALLRSSRAHASRGNGSKAAYRLEDALQVLFAADGLLFPSHAERQARARAVKVDRSQAARSKAVLSHARHARIASAKDAIRSAWASGKYSTRALCAEEEAAALGISFDTARKALRNTPDPS